MNALLGVCSVGQIGETQKSLHPVCMPLQCSPSIGLLRAGQQPRLPGCVVLYFSLQNGC